MKKTIMYLTAFTLVISAWNCGKPMSAEDLFLRAESKRNVSNFPGALEDLESLVTKYPDHSLVAKSRYFIGDIYMNNLKDFHAAVSAYKQVVDLHHGSEMDANAQFMVGFIYANYINDLEKAKEEYSRFLELYPDHNLVKDVNFELQYLGKDINQIPVLKKAAS